MRPACPSAAFFESPADLGLPSLNPRAKLKEASDVYKKDKETLDWYVMQDPKVRFCAR